MYDIRVRASERVSKLQCWVAGCDYNFVLYYTNQRKEVSFRERGRVVTFHLNSLAMIIVNQLRSSCGKSCVLCVFGAKHSSTKHCSPSGMEVRHGYIQLQFASRQNPPELIARPDDSSECEVFTAENLEPAVHLPWTWTLQGTNTEFAHMYPN